MCTYLHAYTPMYTQSRTHRHYANTHNRGRGITRQGIQKRSLGKMWLCRHTMPVILFVGAGVESSRRFEQAFPRFATGSASCGAVFNTQPRLEYPCTPGRTLSWWVLPGDVFSEASLEGGSQHPAFHSVSRQCLCCVCVLTLQKGLLFH